MLYRGMDRAQLDAAYNNSAAVPERDAIVNRLGGTQRQGASPKAPTLAFIHGGYWQMNAGSAKTGARGTAKFRRGNSGNKFGTARPRNPLRPSAFIES